MKAETKRPESFSQLPKSVQKQYREIAELWYTDCGAIFYRGDVVIKGEAFTIDIAVSDINSAQELLYGEEDAALHEDVDILSMLDSLENLFGDSFKDDLESYSMWVKESTAPWELGWKFLTPMLYGAYPSDWQKKFKDQIEKQRDAK